jgi:hypothetical protein
MHENKPTFKDILLKNVTPHQIVPDATLARSSCECELAKGRASQKGGERLERAVFKKMPQTIQQYTHCNVRQMSNGGDAIVEFDMLYNRDNQVITFEVKGLNKYTCSEARKEKIISQVVNQKEYARQIFEGRYIKNVVCLVTGCKEPIDNDFIDKLSKLGFIVSCGRSPHDTIINALQQLEL